MVGLFRLFGGIPSRRLFIPPVLTRRRSWLSTGMVLLPKIQSARRVASQSPRRVRFILRRSPDGASHWCVAPLKGLGFRGLLILALASVYRYTVTC